MLDGSPAHIDEANGNVENNNPVSVFSSSDGLNNKAKQALLKKGGRKLRTAAPSLHHQKPPRTSPSIRLSDHNNNTLTASSVKKPVALPGTELPVGTHTVQSPHHVKQGAKKELLKSKGGRLERGAAQPGGQPARSLPRHDPLTQNVNVRAHTAKQSHAAAAAGASHATKKKDNRSPGKAAAVPQSSPREQKKPLHASNNVKITNAVPEYLKDGEKVYAGAKFSEPPSPSVLPKPPSHWVGENEPLRSDQSREQMTVHLKSLLKVQGSS